MRTTKTPIKNKIQKRLENLVDTEVQVEDITLSNDFAKDLYALFENQGIKKREFRGFWDMFQELKTLYTKYKINDLSDNVDFYNKIQNFFKQLLKSNLFKELNQLDSEEAVETFIQMFKKDEQKPKQQSQGGGQGQKQEQGEDQKPNNQKQNALNDLMKNVKPKQKDQKGLSADSKNIPIDIQKFKDNIQNIEKLIKAGAFDKDDVREHIQKSAGVGTEEMQLKNIVDLIEKIPNKLFDKDLKIFQVARKHEQIEVYKKSEEYSDSLTPDNEIDIQAMKNPNDILKVLPSEYAKNDQEFFMKFAKNELMVRNYLSKHNKKQALYLLVDVSGSMAGDKGIFASGIALSFVNQAIKEKSVYFLRFFEYDPLKLYRITNEEEAKEIRDVLIREPYSYGGTSINNALNQAIRDINNDKEKFKKAEIMLITDGDDNVTLDKKELKNIKLHTTHINYKDKAEHRDLKAISETYTKLNTEDLQNWV